MQEDILLSILYRKNLDFQKKMNVFWLSAKFWNHKLGILQYIVEGSRMSINREIIIKPDSSLCFMQRERKRSRVRNLHEIQLTKFFYKSMSAEYI